MKEPGISLTICIPVYNQDVRVLVRALTRQMAGQVIPCSLLVADDGSDAYCRRLNDELKTIPSVRYLETGENAGRSAIRNYLATMAESSHILFLDGDVSVLREDYVALILQHMEAPLQAVLLGGLEFPHRVARSQRLQQMYGRRVISKQHLKKNKSGFVNFISCNFLMERRAFLDIRFDTRIQGYGHEDTVFGHALHCRQIPIIGVDNPVLKAHLDDNAVYLEKVRQGVHNLRQMASSPEFGHAVAHVQLLQVAKKMKSLRLTALFNGIMHMMEPLLISQLLSGWPMLSILNAFKLYLFSKDQ